MVKKYTVILVDDNEDELFFMKAGLLSSGLFDVVAEANSGLEFLKVIQGRPDALPQLLVSDLNMPGMDGYDIIKEMKSVAHYSHIPIIILSNAPTEPFAEKCKSMGACSYFTKPDTFQEYTRFARQLHAQAESCIEAAC